MEPKDMGTPALAYLGDAVFELLVREHLVLTGISDSGKLNKMAGGFVSAVAQAAALHRILPGLTDEETAFFKRGRNIGHTNTPKSASVTEYRDATGLEVLFGCLHILGRTERINELFVLCFPGGDNDGKI